MYLINLRLLLILFALVLSGISTVANANDCMDFATRSVQQQDENLFNLCGYRGSQWNSNGKKLLRECRVMSKRDQSMRLAMRDKLLASCAMTSDSASELTRLGRNRQQKLLLALIKAIQRQDENLVRSVLKAGANVAAQPSWMSTSPLFLAVKLGNYHLARILIRAGARPYLLAEGEVNPISLLLKDGPTNHAFLEFLLKNKANPNAPGKGVEAEQPIVLAAAKADFRSVDLLLRYKADANLYSEYPAIQKAVRLDHYPMVRALMKGGANPNLGIDGKVCKGKLALDLAYRHASDRIIDILLDNRGLTRFECKRAAATKKKRGRLSKSRAKPNSRNH